MSSATAIFVYCAEGHKVEAKDGQAILICPKCDNTFKCSNPSTCSFHTKPGKKDVTATKCWCGQKLKSETQLLAIRGVPTEYKVTECPTGHFYKKELLKK